VEAPAEEADEPAGEAPSEAAAEVEAPAEEADEPAGEAPSEEPAEPAASAARGKPGPEAESQAGAAEEESA
jgi:hypothetical protein